MKTEKEAGYECLRTLYKVCKSSNVSTLMSSFCLDQLSYWAISCNNYTDWLKSETIHLIQVYLNVWVLPKFSPNISQFQTGVTDVGVQSSSLEVMVMLWPEGLKGRISPSPAPNQAQLGFGEL